MGTKGRLLEGRTVFLMCDMQEKFRSSIKFFEDISVVAQRMIKAAEILGIPVIGTEQYPKGLGHTIPELNKESIKTFEKTSFTMCTPELMDHLLNVVPNLESIVLFGIEAHICVQQTALELSQSFDVHIVADATSSRSSKDRMIAFERIRQGGGFITTSEAVLFSLLQNSNHPKFREIQKLVIEVLPDQDLAAKY